MTSFEIHASRASSASFWVRRLLRRGCLALVLGWLAMWLGTIAHADCAVRLPPAGAGGTTVQISAIDHAPAPRNSLPNSTDPDQCLQLLEQLLKASAAPQATVALPVSDQESANFTLPPAAPPLVVQPVDRLARADLFRPAPPSRVLYLRTSRLLI